MNCKFCISYFLLISMTQEFSALRPGLWRSGGGGAAWLGEGQAEIRLRWESAPKLGFDSDKILISMDKLECWKGIS